MLKTAEARPPVQALCRKHGISEQTYYRWNSKFGDVDVNDARRLRALEDENWRLKALGADLTLDAADPREAKSTWQVAALRTIRAGSAHGFTLAIAHQAPATGRELLDLIRG